MALRLGASMSRKLSRKAATDKNTSTPLMNSTHRMVFRAFQAMPPTVFAVAAADWESSPSARWEGLLDEAVLYLFKSFLSNTVSSLRRQAPGTGISWGKLSHTSAEVIALDDKKPRDYKMATMVLIGVTVAALLVAVVALSLKGREAVPAQGSPAESVMSYYTPKASASQGSAAQPAGDEDGPYRVAVYDGKIGVFRQGEAEPFLTADVEVYLLPQEDIALLRAGLEADTLAEVKAILEDYQ